MDEQKAAEQKTQGDQAQTYERPMVVDYGDIFEITAGGSGNKVDGLHIARTGGPS
jgi:hypothetical protein